MSYTKEQISEGYELLRRYRIPYSWSHGYSISSCGEAGKYGVGVLLCDVWDENGRSINPFRQRYFSLIGPLMKWGDFYEWGHGVSEIKNSREAL